MEIKDRLQIRRLKEDHTIKPFDCGDDDLNGFFLKDAILYQKQKLTVTYFGENESETIFFFSLRNDRVSATDTTKWNKLGVTSQMTKEPVRERTQPLRLDV
jgi:hypothetical protein